jgi:hypothetical protein
MAEAATGPVACNGVQAKSVWSVSASLETLLRCCCVALCCAATPRAFYTLPYPHIHLHDTSYIIYPPAANQCLQE